MSLKDGAWQRQFMDTERRSLVTAAAPGRASLSGLTESESLTRPGHDPDDDRDHHCFECVPVQRLGIGLYK